MSGAHAYETTSLAQRVLLDELEHAFGGDQGARIFVQAALRTARASALPREPGPLLEFVRAHLLGTIAGELGGREATRFLERLTGALGGLHASLHESGTRTREEPATEGELPSVDVTLDLHSTMPPSAAPRSDSARLPVAPPSSGSGRVRVARLRVALAHDDRFGRVGIARHLLQAHCDVVLVDSFASLTAIDGPFPAVAIVHLGLQEVEFLMRGLLTRNPELRVVAILTDGDTEAGERWLEKCGVQAYQLAPVGARASELAAMARRLAVS